MLHLNHPQEVIHQPDTRFTLSVSHWAASWIYHLDFEALPRTGGVIRYTQPSGQSRSCAIARGLDEARRLMERNA
jgi:hypothetical protein